MTAARTWFTAGIALIAGLTGFALGRMTGGTPERQGESSRDARAVVESVSAPARALDDSGGADTGRSGRSGRSATAAGRTTEPGEPTAPPALRGTTASAGAGPVAASPARQPATNGRRRVMLGDLDLTDIGYDRGDPDAPLVLIEFGDFGCPHCGTFARETYPVIDREYVRTGKVYLKYVPFLAGFANGREATRAAECAADQGRFWEMAAAVYDAQSRWQRAWDPHAELRKVAGSAKLDDAAYWACYAVHRPDDRTRRATDAAERVNVRITPSFALNGRPIEGALPIDAFRRLLDAGLLLEDAKR